MRSGPGDDSSRAVERINRTVSELRAQLAPNASNVAESALRTVNTIQALFKVRCALCSRCLTGRGAGRTGGVR